MNYQIEFDSYYSGITPTNRQPDGLSTFKTFGEAKAALVDYLASQRDEWQHALTQARRMTKRDLSA